MFGGILQQNYLGLEMEEVGGFDYKFSFLNSYRIIKTDNLFHTRWVAVVSVFWGIGPFHLNCQIYVCRVVHTVFASYDCSNKLI